MAHLILVFSFEESENNNLSYIPENATSVYRLDGRVVTRELLASLLLSEDEVLNKMTQSKIPKTKDGKLKPVGISFDSDVIMFRLVDGEDQFTGLLFNLWDHRTFRRNMPKYIGKNSAIASTETVGLLLMKPGVEITESELKSHAEKILSKETQFSKKHPEPESASMISVWYREGNSSVSDVGLSLQDNQLIIEGSFKSEEEIEIRNLSRNKGGFHIHSQWFPDAWNGIIQRELKTQGINIPSIRQFSFNYFGGFIVTDPNVALLPILDGSIEFDEPVVLDSLLKGFNEISSEEVSKKRTFDILSRPYRIHQVNDRTLEISSDQKLDLQPAKLTSVAELSGSPKHLLHIEGDAFIKRILQLSSEYRAAGSLINEITSIDIKMTRGSGKNYRIRGVIALKDDKWPLNELIKFLIRSKIF